MKKEDFFAVIGELDEDQVRDARIPMGRAKKRGWKAWGAMAACLALVMVVGTNLLNIRRNTLELSDASQGVTVRYTNKISKTASSNALISLTEEELFSHFDTVIFKGTVTEINNIVLDFNGSKSYRAIAEIRIEQVYRGDCRKDETVSVLLPCPIQSGAWVEDTETVSAMKTGMTGIFMPMVYDESSVWQENGATLVRKDLADYGFADGSRYAFLETEEGLVFDRWAYESIADADDLDEIEEYILAMLGDSE